MSNVVSIVPVTGISEVEVSSSIVSVSEVIIVGVVVGVIVDEPIVIIDVVDCV